MGWITNRPARRAAAVLAVSAAWFLAAPATGQSPEWFRGTGVISAHDKALAHDLAYRAAIADAGKYCGGTMAGASEEKVTYDFLPATEEWRVEVRVRALCQALGGLP